MKVFYRFKIKEIKLFEKELLKRNKKVKITTTNYSILFETEKEKFLFNNEYLGFGAIRIINNTRINILKNIKDNKFEIKEAKPEYFNYNPIAFSSNDGRFFGATEIDVNSAYLQSAWLQNIIDDKTYERLRNVNKKLRLRALGAIAVKKNVQNYEGGRLIKSIVKQDKKLKSVWNMICRGCDELVYNIIDMNDRDRYLFYWFDNLYVHEDPKKIKVWSSSLYKVKYPFDLSYTKHLDYLNIIVNSEKTFNLRI